MVKKLIIGGLIVVLAGVLVGGIYSYTQNFNPVHAGQAQAYGEGGGQGYRAGLAEDSGAPVAGAGGQGYRGGRVGDDVAPGSGDQGQTTGRGRAGNATQEGDKDGVYEPDPQAHVEEWLTLTGQVVSVDSTGLTLQTDDGQTLSISLGPEWFWSDQDVSVAAGEQVTLQAFEEEGEIKVGQISLESQGTVLELRDVDGRPLWAGRGRGGGRR